MLAKQAGVVPGPRKVLYKKAYGKFDVEVSVLPSHRIVVYAMQGYIFVEHIDEYLKDLLEVVASTKPIGMVADPRQMKVLSPEFQRAVQTRFWPEIARLGVKRNPAIVPHAAVTRTSVNRMVTMTGEVVKLENGLQVEIALLHSLEECLEWILQDAPPPSRAV